MAISFKNHFLIAMPSLNDTFFYHSVVYVCDHDDQGATGIIINRPTQVMLPELLTQLNIQNDAEQSKTTPIFFGGPVQKSQGMVLHDSADNWNASSQIADNIFLTTSTDILKAVGSDKGPDHILIALGYAAWSPGQLEQEITDNDWLTVAADNDILFNTPSKQRWHAAASLLGIDIALLSSAVGHA